MAQYKRVDEEPKELKDNECVIYKPSFQEEIEATRKRRGVSGLTKANSLRDIFMAITDKYDQSVNPYHMKLTKYEGIAYETDDDLRKILFKIMKDHDTDLLNKAVDHAIKNRPENTDFIYYVSDDLAGSSAFIKQGINMAENKKKVKVNE